MIPNVPICFLFRQELAKSEGSALCFPYSCNRILDSLQGRFSGVNVYFLKSPQYWSYHIGPGLTDTFITVYDYRR